MASGSGSNMEAIAKAIASNQLNAEIKVLIYNNPEALVRSRAAKYHIPTVLINHRDYQQRAELDRVIVNTLSSYPGIIRSISPASN